MTKVLTVGVFDYYHYGHLRLFERARALGDYLIVAVQDDDYILRFKPNAQIYYSTEKRIEMVSALRVVDQVEVYKSVDDFVKQVDFDIFVIGEDQVHEGFQKAVAWCEANKKSVVRLSRTQGVSSSEIKSRKSSIQ